MGRLLIVIPRELIIHELITENVWFLNENYCYATCVWP